MEIILHADSGSSHDTLYINSVMSVVTLILYGNKCIGKLLRDLVHAYIGTVGILGYELCHLMAFRVI